MIGRIPCRRDGSDDDVGRRRRDGGRRCIRELLGRVARRKRGGVMDCYC